MRNVTTIEQLFETDPEKYFRLHESMEIAGMEIPKGSRVQISRWGIQNGIAEEGTRGTKIGNARDGRCIRVQKSRHKSIGNYWAGFWERIC